MSTRINLVTNPSFELNLASWYATGLAFPTPTQSSTWSQFGTKSLLISQTITAINTYSGIQYNYVDVTAGNTYAFSAYLNVSSYGGGTNYGQLIIAWFNSSYTYISQDYGSTFTTTGISRQGIIATAPAGAVYASPIFYVNYGNTSGVYTAYIDNILFEMSSSIVSYFDGSFVNAGWTGVANASTSVTATDLIKSSEYSVVVTGHEKLNSSLLKKLKIGKKYGPVTSVVLGRVPQNDNVVVSRISPLTNIISSINTTTNLFTATANGMVDGNIVRVESTGILPAPLLINTNYFVYTAGDSNTFALTPTYADGIAGTNIIDITTSGAGTITLSHLETQEVQINNNQILDDDRASLLPSIYSKLVGLEWNEISIETTGLGWFEVGDIIEITQGLVTVSGFVSEVHLTLDGSIKETLVSIIPAVSTIDYQTAGGVLKTLYNTEIKVDKQNNDIESIVSQQTTFENTTTDNFTDVYQTIDGVTTTIQSSGGSNLILNSAGYAKETNGTLSFWTQSGTGTITAASDTDSLSVGATSGSVIKFVGSTVQILQRIAVATGAYYSVGFRVKKTAGDGSARLYLTNAVTSTYIDIVAGTAYTWEELKLENISPGQNYWDVKLVVTGSTTSIQITDLRVLLGDTLSQWSQSASEIINAQVSLTTNGIRVTSSAHSGDYTLMTPEEFAGYSDVSGLSSKVFTVNRDTTQVANLQVSGTSVYGSGTLSSFNGVIREVVIPSGSKAGLAFVGVVS